MTALCLTRRSSLLLPLLLAACGSDEPANFDALRYDYLPPIPLNVVTVDIEQHFVPSGVAPDVTPQAPVKPATALRTMAEDRLRPFGGKGRALFTIQNASLVRRDGTLNGTMAVVLTVYRESGEKGGFVEAQVVRRETGSSGSLRTTLYQMVRSMMDQMNVELEFQIRRNLRDWVTEPVAAPRAVEQAPLAAPQRL